MALDQTANFVRVTVSGTHTDTDTTIQLENGEASELPDPANGEYNLVWWNDTEASRPSADPNVEIVRVTGRDTTNDTITVERGQEDTTAVAHDVSGDTYRMLLGATAKMFADINDVTNLSGSAGSSGQFLQTDGTNLSFASISTKAFEEVADFSSIPSSPEPGKGFTTTDKGELFVEVNN